MTIAKRIADARLRGEKLTQYPGDPPVDLRAAYRVQQEMADHMGSRVVGWKVGVTSDVAQDTLGVAHPLAGPLFADLVYDSGAVIGVSEHDQRIVEPEIGFRVGVDLPPRGAAYDRDEVLAAIDAVLPVIELVSKRLPGWLKERAEWIVADGTYNQALVVGTLSPFAEAISIKEEQVRAFENDMEIDNGVGSNALGDPLNVMVWLANQLNEVGQHLREGDIVATGLVTGLIVAKAGKTYRADYSTLGSVEITLIPR
ncbi:MAG: fumarylacetoacetate hydrolase family protein [Pseudomonadota bacterium]